jgi:hypothetical protein
MSYPFPSKSARALTVSAPCFSTRALKSLPAANGSAEAPAAGAFAGAAFGLPPRPFAGAGEIGGEIGDAQGKSVTLYASSPNPFPCGEMSRPTG